MMFLIFLKSRPGSSLFLSTTIRCRKSSTTVVNSVEFLAKEKNLALKVSVSPDLTVGKGDEQRIAQVFLNLVGNAIKFTEEGEVKVEVTSSNSKFFVAVSDTGPGLSAADQQRIFEEFHQADSSSTRKKGRNRSRSLRFLKRSIADARRAASGLESSPGQGSTFLVHTAGSS